MQFPYGPFAPDAGRNAIGTCMRAEGVLPAVEGYGPAPSMIGPGIGDALPDDPRGSITTIKRDGTTQVFFLTASALYRLEADYTFTELETGYACTAGTDWSCEQFGNFLLYTNTTDGLWAYNIETGGAATYIANAGDPRSIFVTANMVFALDCKDDLGDRNNRLIRNSNFNNHTDWKNGSADQQPLEGGGELLAGVNLKNGAAVTFQRGAMRLIQFGNVGGGAMYSLQEIAEGRGSIGGKSIVGFDGVVYFLATNGFWRFSGGGLEPIGAGFVDEWFLDQVPATQLKDVQAAIDPARKIVLWLTPSGMILGYCWSPNVTNRWFTWLTSAVFLSRLATSGYTWDAAGAVWATWDAMPQIPFDDRFWQGGQQFLGALDEDLTYKSFSGEAQEAVLETSTGNSPVTTLISWATPIDDARNGTLALGVADTLNAPPGVSDATETGLTWKDGSAKVSSGRTPQRGRGLNIAWRRTIPAGANWTYAKGVDHIKASAGGPK
jgi:hypothetical protein